MSTTPYDVDQHAYSNEQGYYPQKDISVLTAESPEIGDALAEVDQQSEEDWEQASEVSADYAEAKGYRSSTNMGDKPVPGALFGDLSKLFENTMGTTKKNTQDKMPQQDAYRAQAVTEIRGMLQGAIFLHEPKPDQASAPEMPFDQLIKQFFVQPDQDSSLLFYQTVSPYDFDSVETNFILSREQEGLTKELMNRISECMSELNGAQLESLEILRNDIFDIQTKPHINNAYQFFGNLRQTTEEFHTYHLIDDGDYERANTLLMKQVTAYEREKTKFEKESRDDIKQKYARYFDRAKLAGVEAVLFAAAHGVSFNEYLTVLEKTAVSANVVGSDRSKLFTELLKERQSYADDLEAFETEHCDSYYTQTKTIYYDSARVPEKKDMAAYMNYLDWSYRLKWRQLIKKTDPYPDSLTTENYDGDLPADALWQGKLFETEAENKLFEMLTGDDVDNEYGYAGYDLYAQTPLRNTDGKAMSRQPQIMPVRVVLTQGDSVIPPPENAGAVVGDMQKQYQLFQTGAEDLIWSYQHIPVSTLTGENQTNSNKNTQYVSEATIKDSIEGFLDTLEDLEIMFLPEKERIVKIKEKEERKKKEEENIAQIDPPKKPIINMPEGTTILTNPTRERIIQYAMEGVGVDNFKVAAWNLESAEFQRSKEFKALATDIAVTENNTFQRYSGGSLSVKKQIESQHPEYFRNKLSFLMKGVFDSSLGIISHPQDLYHALADLYASIDSMIEINIEAPEIPQPDASTVWLENAKDKVIVFKDQNRLQEAYDYYYFQEALRKGEVAAPEDVRIAITKNIWAEIVQSAVSILKNHQEAINQALDTHFQVDTEKKETIKQSYQNCLALLESAGDYLLPNPSLTSVKEHIQKVQAVLDQAHVTLGLKKDVEVALSEWGAYQKAVQESNAMESSLALPELIGKSWQEFVSGQSNAKSFVEIAQPVFCDSVAKDWLAVRSFADFWYQRLGSFETEVYQHIWPKDAKRFIYRLRVALYTLELELQRGEAANHQPLNDGDDKNMNDIAAVVTVAVVDLVKTIPWGWPTPDGYSPLFGTVIDKEFKPDGSSFMTQEEFIELIAGASLEGTREEESWRRLQKFLEDYYPFFCPSFTYSNETKYPIRSYRNHDVYNRLVLIFKYIAQKARANLLTLADTDRVRQLRYVRDLANRFEFIVQDIMQNRAQESYWYERSEADLLNNIFPTTLDSKSPNNDTGGNSETAITKARGAVYRAYDDPYYYYRDVVDDYHVHDWSFEQKEAWKLEERIKGGDTAVRDDWQRIKAYELALGGAKEAPALPYRDWLVETSWENDTLYVLGRLAQRLHAPFDGFSEKRYAEIKNVFQEMPRETLQAWIEYCHDITDEHIRPSEYALSRITHGSLPTEYDPEASLARSFVYYLINRIEAQSEPEFVGELYLGIILPPENKANEKSEDDSEAWRLDGVVTDSFLTLVDTLTPAELLWSQGYIKKMLFVDEIGNTSLDDFRVQQMEQVDVDEYLFSLRDEETLNLAERFIAKIGFLAQTEFLRAYTPSKIKQMIEEGNPQLARMVIVNILEKGTDELQRPIRQAMMQVICEDPFLKKRLVEKLLETGDIPLSLNEQESLAKKLIEQSPESKLVQIYRYQTGLDMAAQEIEEKMNGINQEETKVSVKLVQDIIWGFYHYGDANDSNSILESVVLKPGNETHAGLSDALKLAIQEGFERILSKEQWETLAMDSLEQMATQQSTWDVSRVALMAGLMDMDQKNALSLAQNVMNYFSDDQEEQMAVWQNHIDFINEVSELSPSNTFSPADRLFAVAYLSHELYRVPARNQLDEIEATLSGCDDTFDAERVRNVFAKYKTRSEKEYFLRLYSREVKISYYKDTKAFLSDLIGGQVIMDDRTAEDGRQFLVWLDSLMADPKNEWAQRIMVTDEGKRGTVRRELVEQMDNKLTLDMVDVNKVVEEIDPLTLHVLQNMLLEVKKHLNYAIDKGANNLKGNLLVVEILEKALFEPFNRNDPLECRTHSVFNRRQESQKQHVHPRDVLDLNDIYQVSHFEQISGHPISDRHDRDQLDSILAGLNMMLSQDLNPEDRENMVQKTWDNTNILELVLQYFPDLKADSLAIAQLAGMSTGTDTLEKGLEYCINRLQTRFEEMKAEDNLTAFHSLYQAMLADLQMSAGMAEVRVRYQTQLRDSKRLLQSGALGDPKSAEGLANNIEYPQEQYRMKLNTRIHRAIHLSEIMIGSEEKPVVENGEPIVMTEEVSRFELKKLMLTELGATANLDSEQNMEMALFTTCAKTWLGLEHVQYKDPRPVGMTDVEKRQLTDLSQKLSLDDRILICDCLEKLEGLTKQCSQTPEQAKILEILTLMEKELIGGEQVISILFPPV